MALEGAISSIRHLAGQSIRFAVVVLSDLPPEDRLHDGDHVPIQARPSPAKPQLEREIAELLPAARPCGLDLAIASDPHTAEGR